MRKWMLAMAMAGLAIGASAQKNASEESLQHLASLCRQVDELHQRINALRAEKAELEVELRRWSDGQAPPNEETEPGNATTPIEFPKPKEVLPPEEVGEEITPPESGNEAGTPGQKDDDGEEVKTPPANDDDGELPERQTKGKKSKTGTKKANDDGSIINNYKKK